MLDKMDRIKHFRRFPCLKPWVGRHYRCQLHKRLLIIGESHYLPPDATIHLDADKWYTKAQEHDLCSCEKAYLSTSGIIRKNKTKNFPNRAHSIYRNICIAVNSSSFHYEESQHVVDHIAYYNFFQRPADVSGESIKAQEIDCIIAKQVLASIMQILSPQLVIFASAYAGHLGKETVESKGVPVLITPHPACAWWNRTSKKYHGKGRNLVPQFLTVNNWMNTQQQP